MLLTTCLPFLFGGAIQRLMGETPAQCIAAILMLGLLICANGQRIKWLTSQPDARNPLKAFSDSSPPLTESSGDGYDVFLSYRSEDVALVRLVAERLMSLNIRVWFAEYQILLHARHRFQAAIDRAVPASRWFAAFTRPTYYQSQHCMSELELARNTASLNGRMLNLKLAGCAETNTEGLQFASVVELMGDASDLHQAVEFIRSYVATQCAPPSIPRTEASFLAPQVCERMSHRFRYQIDLAGWRVDKDGGLLLDCDLAEVRASIQATFENVAPRPFHLSPGNLKMERDCFDRSVKFAKSWVQGQPAEVLGVHMMLSHGVSHFSMTYWLNDMIVKRVELAAAFASDEQHYIKLLSAARQDFFRYWLPVRTLSESDQGGAWHRRYSMVFRDQEQGTSVEYDISIGCRGTFEAFCTLTDWMDRLAASVSHLGAPKRQAQKRITDADMMGRYSW